MRNITHIVVHCTGAAQSQTIDSIKNFWKNVNKWRNVGYHKIIEANGTVSELAKPSEITNGVAGHNSKSYHICYIGGKDGKDNRTEFQKATLLLELKKAKKMFPNAIILGHRDLSPDLNNDGIIQSNEWTKLCPSFDAKKEYKDV
ncbi:N-acetylmuramoyl-L-alanine amidase [Flavobacterium sp. TAB 87]|uniref:N-acetylmuramoyl-L-alanine amidase n=1 Tax=Flavobacterium sp. TAB 87 TaxID=1729581 RepID=UPI00076D92D7|nr:N-acetylmuramoyl-L-alanine amidase [Flavobacterium sp. TAB 87]KVV16134.1 lysozyme [Flavobacterium sp. TAB 87]